HNENPLVCALAGIGVGCAVGMGTNYALDYVRDHYRNREQQLEAVAKELKADNDRARSFATATQKLLDEEQLELRRLEADLQAGAVSQDRLGEKLRGMDANIEYMQGNIAKAKERLRTHEQIRSELLEGADERQLARIDGEIASLRDSIAQMEANLDEYSQQRNALKVRS
ncbi:MAG: hypothetical protein K6A65_02715, partial [Succinivibrionaceae bacterium]|nr:hypothetical protein [Succinivibrionaceae bacterium]